MRDWFNGVDNIVRLNWLMVLGHSVDREKCDTDWVFFDIGNVEANKLATRVKSLPRNPLFDPAQIMCPRTLGMMLGLHEPATALLFTAVVCGMAPVS